MIISGRSSSDLVSYSDS